MQVFFQVSLSKPQTLLNICLANTPRIYLITYKENSYVIIYFTTKYLSTNVAMKVTSGIQ